MHDPNLQIAPKAFLVEAGREFSVRNVFVASPGFVLLGGDYSQLELRVLSHLSGDEKLLKILNSENGDVFRIIAASWQNVPVASVTDVQRQQAKQICYGIIYGMGVSSLAEQLCISHDSAEEFLDSFKRQFLGVQRWMLGVVADAKKLGYIKTLSGRRRYLPKISGSGCSVADISHAERQAINSVVQGSAADLFKTALIKLNRDYSEIT